MLDCPNHLRVGIVPEAPIAYLNELCINTTQSEPECWYGWSPDIIAKLAHDLHFTYEYVRPDDDKYGGLDRETLTWNGMVKDLLDKKTDMTIALAINQDRSTYIDFTSSFFEDQASFVVSESSVANSGDTFFFLKPFDTGVWISIICLIILISILISCFSKLSPYGKYGRKIHAFQVCKCEDCEDRRKARKTAACTFEQTKKFSCEVEKVEDDDTLHDMSLYNIVFTVGTGFVGQGGEHLPVAPSGRFLLFMWWLFVMIITAMYTANFTAYLTLERSGAAINTIEALLDQEIYKWGIIGDRNLESLMLTNPNPTYQQLVSEAMVLRDVDHGIEMPLSYRYQPDVPGVPATELASRDMGFLVHEHR
eukprot:sb/3465922/